MIAIIKKYKIELVIDLHGCSNMHEFDCGIWTDNFKTCNFEIASLLSEKLEQKNFICDVKGKEYLGGQVTRQVGLLTNGLQLEVKRYIRSLKKENMQELYKFIDGMCSAIHEINGYFEKYRG